MNIGLAIKAIRKKLNVGQQELSHKCGISQTSLSLIETCAKKPSQKTIKKICDALEIPEAIIYIVAMQESDVSENKRGIYKIIYPSIKSLALQMVNTEHLMLVDETL